MGEEQLLLWYNRYDPATDTYPNPNLNSFRVVDEHGCVFHVNSYGGSGGGVGYSVSSAHVRVFPRRQKAFKVRAQSSPVTNIEWTVENPFVTNPPAWTPEALCPAHWQGADACRYATLTPSIRSLRNPL